MQKRKFTIKLRCLQQGIHMQLKCGNLKRHGEEEHRDL